MEKLQEEQIEIEKVQKEVRKEEKVKEENFNVIHDLLVKANKLQGDNKGYKIQE